MAGKKRVKADVEPKARWVINGKDLEEHTPEEQEAYRAAITDRVLEVSLRPVEEKFGPARVGAVLRAFLDEWNKERAGKGPKFWEPLMMNGDVPWPMMLGRVIDWVLTKADKERNEAEELLEERQLPLWTD